MLAAVCPVDLRRNDTPLFEALKAYADAYEVAYGQRESVADLIPFMLERFLASDRGFAKARSACQRREP